MQNMASPRCFAFIFLVYLKTWSMAGKLNDNLKYVIIKDRDRWTSNVTAFGPELFCSIGQCAGACNQLSTDCRGFAYQQTSSSSSQLTADGPGHCQLVSVSGTGDATLNPALRSHRLYLNQYLVDQSVDPLDPCTSSGSCYTTASNFAGTTAETTVDEQWLTTSRNTVIQWFHYTRDLVCEYCDVDFKVVSV